jgi:hypothetical protein
VTALVLLEAVVLAVLCLLVVGLLRSHAAVLRRLHELGAGLEELPGQARPRLQVASGPSGGAAAADVAGVTPSGEAIAVRVVGAPHDTVLAFLSSTCSSCQPFWDDLARGRFELPTRARLLVVAHDLRSEIVEQLVDLAPRDVPVVCSADAWRDYQVPGSPYVVLVDGPSGRIRGQGTGADLRQVTAHLEEASSWS